MMDNNFDWYLTDRFGKKYFFYKSQIIVGRKDCDIQLKSTSVNYKHCVLTINENENVLRIKDFNTANGTFVNDKQIDVDEFRLLNVGDKIRLAYDQITFTVSKKATLVTPGSPLRGLDIPCLVTDPEKSMTSALCELSDSIIDLNTSNDLQVDVTQSDNYDNEENNDIQLPTIEPQQHHIQEVPSTESKIAVQVTSTKDEIKIEDDILVSLSKPAETFTINFDLEETSELDTVSVGVSRFVPSKLRASFEERDKIKRTKNPTVKTSIKTETVLPKNTETIRIGKSNGKTSATHPQSTKAANVRSNSKPEEKLSVRAKNLSNKTKTLGTGTERSLKPKSATQSQTQSTEKNELIDKVKQSRSSKISTPNLIKKNSKSNLFEKTQIEDDFINRNKGSSEKVQQSRVSEIRNSSASTRNQKLSLFGTGPLRDDTDSLNYDSNEKLPPFQSTKVSTPTLSKKNSKSYLFEKNSTEDPIERIQTPPPPKMAYPTLIKKNSKSYLFEKHSVEEPTERVQTPPPPKMTFPTLSKKNSKSYLLEKMLLGDDSSVDFSTYEESRLTGAISDNESHRDGIEQIAKVNIDLKGSIGNLSETGTYVIEDCVDNKTVDLNDSDDTLAKDNSSSISSHQFNSKTELESKSSGKWLSEYPDDDVSMNCDGKNKRIINSKFTGTSMPHIPNDEYFLSNKRDNYRDDEHSKSNFNCLMSDNRQRINRNSNSRSTDDDNNNKRNSALNSMDTQHHYDPNLQNAYSSYSNIAYSMGNESIIGAEDFYVPDIGTKSTVPSNSCNKVSGLQQKIKPCDIIASPQINTKHHPRSTFSVASLDTALLLQDTEALLNDMEKRVYSRKDKRDETSKSQSFSTNMFHGDKIPFVDEADEKEEDSSLFSYPTEVEENVRNNSIKPQQQVTYNDQIIVEDKNRSYAVRSPINSGNIRRNNSCKLGISESMTLSRKLNSTIRNQRSCSMIEEQRLNHLTNNNNNNPELFNDYRSKSKPSVLAMNSGIFLNRRGSAGISSALNSPVSRLEPGSFFNNSFSVQRPKDVFPYFSTNLLSLHRQRFNRYEYGQHSLKYNSNSTTMLYSKYNNTSPPWNGEDTTVSPNSFYPTYDTDYYAYNTMPEPLDASMLLSKHEHNIANHNNNSQIHVSNLELNPEIDYNKREDMGEYSQPCNASGRSSAFSPVNSLHQSTESVNNYQMASKSRSSIGLNEQRHCNYDSLLVSSVHRYSARLCRYTEEIVHRMRREGSEYQGNSPVDTVFDQSDSFGQIKSVNRELQETVSNLRSLEKQLQKVERLLFPVEKSGRNSTAGSCTEDNYLNQLERINKELKDFVPIDDPQSGANKLPNAKLSIRGEYSYMSNTDTKENIQVNLKPIPLKEKVSGTTRNGEMPLEPPKSPYNNNNNNNNNNGSDIRSTPKSKYGSISKRFQHRKD